MNKIKEATKLVDLILSGDYKEYKVLKDSETLVDKIIGEVENKLDTVPDQDISSLYQTVADELSEDEDEDENEDDYMDTDDEDENGEGEFVDMNGDEDENGEEEFIDMNGDEDEDEYEDTVEESLMKTVGKIVTENEYQDFFQSMLKKWNVSSPSELDDEKKKEFFRKVDALWKGKKESD